MRQISVVVSLGTDHHPFERLMRWLERWLAEYDGEVDLFVQHGATPAPSVGQAAEMLSRDEMLEHYRAADIVITQVGPGSIADVAASGKLPITIPRDPTLGEHVDGHQIAYGRVMQRLGRVILVEDEQTFRAELARVIADPRVVITAPRTIKVDETARALAALVDDIMSRPAGLIRWSRILPSRRRVARPLASRRRAPSMGPAIEHIAAGTVVDRTIVAAGAVAAVAALAGIDEAGRPVLKSRGQSGPWPS